MPKENAAVILLSANGAIGLKVLYCLKMAGYDVHVASLAANNALCRSRYVSGFRSVHETSAEALTEILNRYADATDAATLVGDDIVSHGMLNRLADRLTRPVYPVDEEARLDLVHDKSTFATLMKERNLSIPETITVHTLEDVERAVTAAGRRPLVCKPLTCEASHGVFIAEGGESLFRYLDTPGPYKSFPLIIQEFVEGQDVGVSLLARDGDILTTDVMYNYPTHREIRSDPDALQLADSIIRALRYSGPAYIDMRRRPDGTYFALECNPRFWFSVTVNAWMGGNFPAMAADLALGKTPPRSPTRPGVYYPTMDLVRAALCPRKLRAVTLNNWRGFYQAISDPAAHFAPQNAG